MEIGAFPWFKPSPKGCPPCPPPKKENITQRLPSFLNPANESALIVPYAHPFVSSGEARANAWKTRSIIRRIVSVYPPTGFGALTDKIEFSSMIKSTGSRTPELAGTSGKTCFIAT